MPLPPLTLRRYKATYLPAIDLPTQSKDYKKRKQKYNDVREKVTLKILSLEVNFNNNIYNMCVCVLTVYCNFYIQSFIYTLFSNFAYNSIFLLKKIVFIVYISRQQYFLASLLVRIYILNYRLVSISNPNIIFHSG